MPQREPGNRHRRPHAKVKPTFHVAGRSDVICSWIGTARLCSTGRRSTPAVSICSRLTGCGVNEPNSESAEAKSGQRDGERSPLPAYLLAHGGKTLFWIASDLYFVFYMNKVCGIAPIITGLIVGGSILLAALADFGIGRILGSRIRTAKQAGQLQLTGGIGAAVTLSLFAATAYLDANWRIAACVISLLLFRLTYALMDVPQNALMSMIPRTTRELSTLVAGRNIAGGICKIALAAAFVPIMRDDAPVEAAPRFLWLVTCIAVLAITGFCFLAVRLRSRQYSAPAPYDAEGRQIEGHLVRMAVASAMLTGFTQLQPYIAIEEIHAAGAAAIFLTAIAAGSILSQPLWHWRAQTSPRRLWREVLFSTFIAALSIVVMPLDLTSGSIVAGALCGLGSGGMLFTLWAEFAKSLSGSEALFAYGRFTGSAKLGQGIATIAIGSWLQLSGSHTAIAWEISMRWIAALTIFIGAIIVALVPTHVRRQFRTEL